MNNEEMKNYLIKLMNDDFGLRDNPKPYNPSKFLRAWHKFSFAVGCVAIFGTMDYFLNRSTEISRHKAKIDAHYESFFMNFTDEELKQYHDYSKNWTGSTRVINASKQALWSSHYSRIQNRSKVFEMLEKKIDQLEK
eukprot:gene10101-2521_t